MYTFPLQRYIVLRLCCLGLLGISLGVWAQEDAVANPSYSYTVQPGDNLSAIAQRFGSDVASLVALNGLSEPDSLAVGQSLIIDARALALPEPLPAPFVSFTLEPAIASTGRVQWLEVETSQPLASLEAHYLGQRFPLRLAGNRWQGWIATPVLHPPGVVSLEVYASPDHDTASPQLSIPVQVQASAYVRERIQLSPSVSSLLDPSTSREERALIDSLCSRYSPQLYGQHFRYPLANPVHTSDFGTLRAYNEGGYTSFHGGLDLRANHETPILAPAAGIVQFAGELSIRGNTVVIDHGLGLCSGYMHLSEIAVHEGMAVEQGTRLGQAGATGLVTAPHLHWEIRLMSVAIDPVQWLDIP